MTRITVLLIALGGAVGIAQPAPTARVALSDFFKPGVVFQDRNNDGVVDFVNARLVLAPQPAAGDVAAAADIAARLGFETSAMDLPLRRARPEPVALRRAQGDPEPAERVDGRARSGQADDGASQPTIFVGLKSLGGSGVTVDSLAAGAPLKAGDGLVAAFSSNGQPALAVLGGDDAGMTAAGMLLAGHLPSVWDQKGPTIDKIADEVKEFLVTKGITAVAAVSTAAFVRSNTDGAERVVVDLQLAPVDVIKAQVALNQMVAIGARDAKRPLSYANIRTLRVRLRGTGGAASSVDIPRATAASAEAAPPAQPPARRPGGGAKDSFDLSSFYANEGALSDSDNNLIPDRVDVLLTADGDGTDGLVDLAARLGLESTGIALPIAKPPKSITSGDSEPMLVIVGVSHPLLDQLSATHKWEKPPLAPGEGLIQVVKKAFGEKAALIVTGGDAAGLARALDQLAERLPHIWARGKDRTTLDQVEDDLRRFVAGRSPAGQAAMALYKIDKIGEQLRGKDLASARIRVYVEKADGGLAGVVKTRAASSIAAPSIDVSVQDLDVQKGRPLVTDDVAIPSEVDELLAKVRKAVTPLLKPKKRQPVTIEARLSEPVDVRRRVEQELKAELVKAGAEERSTTVTILSAYKQGYHWLYEVVRPELTGKAVDRITIKFAEIGPPAGWKQQGMFAPTRWLLELYPIDEILANELKLDRTKIKFEMTPVGSPAYEVIAQARDGAELFKRTFEPKIVERPFFDRFPDYERVRVTTGWVKADVAGKTVTDERIATDPERFWDLFQSKTLPALYDHVMALGRGKPRAEDAPFFGELNVDLTLSEPEYRLPIDQEQVSSMEALHEEIYFNTLHFFDVMGRFTRSAGLAYPGRVIPVMHPKADGKPGRARITVTGFDASRPSVVVEYVEKSGRRGELRLDVPKIAVERPQALAAAVRAGTDGIERLDLRVKVDTERDEREKLIARTADDRVDRTMLSAEQVNAVLVNLGQFRASGIYRDALAYHDFGAMKVAIGWEHESKPGTEIVATLEGNGKPADWPDIAKYRTADVASTSSTGPFVQWDTPIPPPEAYAILAKMSSFKEASVYKVGESYLGKDVWAMDLMPPVTASHWSQAKQTTLKPTIVYSARQHANEVSSTSHVLRMAELLLTDPVYREKLNKVNVVIHPITNADGAQLAYDLQKINPTYMLHAGYLGALGVDVTNGQWDADPIYPESGIRPKIWRTWLPDIFLNPHGYPSHEWVQLFSEYAAWVRTRAVETRDYWTMRGWWMPGFAWLDDPRYPRHKDEQMKLLEMITQYARASADTVALNERAYDRYKRYSFDFDQKNFKLDFTNGVLIYKSIKGARANPQAQDFMARNPNVTIWEGVTEAPDETARGDWMKLVANAGLQWDKAILEYLVQGRHEIERKVDPFWNGVSLSINRPRPPKPAKAVDEKPTTAEQVK